MCFEASIAIFLLFTMGDTLFGDRTELWEHGTFMILALVTYDLWSHRDAEYIEPSEADLAAAAPAS